MNDIPQIRQLATTLHDNFCNDNHTDGCSWGWEKGNDNQRWELYAHAKWYKKAKYLYETYGLDYDQTLRYIIHISTALKM